MKEIVQDGAPVLRKIARAVPARLFGSTELAGLIDDMMSVLESELEGVALAAPQLGTSYRLFIVRKDRTIPPPKKQPEGTPVPPPPPAEIETYVNPEIVKTSKRKSKMDEGCLSVRGVYGTTSRHQRVTIRALHADGSRFERGAGGIMAQIFEHEIDHLNGILFTDHAEHIIHVQHATTA
jgi:peptide deformylase